ncbi:MAG: FeoC-like transcriptional regulator [Rhodospirillales bacterium]|nr:FeoC-like transcriptional regulator [Rhodospirillales bacterium]
MILSELKSYLVDRRRVPITDIAIRFGVTPDAARGMLDVWARKGRVRRVEDGGQACGGCCGCTGGQPEIYEWLDEHPSSS